MGMTPRLITIDGETRSVTEWSRVPGAAKYATIITRLGAHWTNKEAVFGRDKPFPGRSGWPQSFRDAVVAAVIAGGTVRDVAADYGVSTASVWLWAKGRVEPRKPGPKKVLA